MAERKQTSNDGCSLCKDVETGGESVVNQVNWRNASSGFGEKGHGSMHAKHAPS